MFHELYSLRDVASMLAVKPHRILYLLSVGAVPEPRLRVGGRRLWTLPEITQISELCKLQIAYRQEAEKARARG